MMPMASGWLSHGIASLFAAALLAVVEAITEQPENSVVENDLPALSAAVGGN